MARLNGCRLQDGVTCRPSHGFMGGSIAGTAIVMGLIGWRFLRAAICGLSEATETAVGRNRFAGGSNGLAWPRHYARRQRSRSQFPGISHFMTLLEVCVSTQANNGTGNEDRRQIDPSSARRGLLRPRFQHRPGRNLSALRSTGATSAWRISPAARPLEHCREGFKFFVRRVSPAGRLLGRCPEDFKPSVWRVSLGVRMLGLCRERFRLSI